MIENLYYRGGYDESQAAMIIQQVLEAVAYIHSKGVAHNQLYPVNVLHVNKGEPRLKVIDLDEVGNQPQKDLDKFMRYGDYRGCYVAPEVIKGEWSIKNDEWAVGVMMYYLLTGWVPFFGDDTKDTFRVILEYKFDRGYAFEQISDEGKDLMLRLMAFKAEDRISAAEALKHAWFKRAQRGDYSEKELGDVLNNLKKFHAGGKLKQAI